MVGVLIDFSLEKKLSALLRVGAFGASLVPPPLEPVFSLPTPSSKCPAAHHPDCLPCDDETSH